jgi:hypothetical protein
MSKNDVLYDKGSFPEESVEKLIPEPSEEEIAQFKQQISEWIKIDEQIRKLSIALRERKTHQRALGKKVQEFMIQHKYTNIDTKLGIIKSNVADVPVPVKLVDVRTKVDALDDNVKLTKKEIIEKFFKGDRPTVKKQSLSRKVPKVSMHLDL